MAKHRGGHHRSFTLPMATLGGLAAGMYWPIQNLMAGDYAGALDSIAWRYAGIAGVKSGNPHFDAGGLMGGAVPLVAGVLISKFIGGKLGVNRAIARTGIPILRL